MGAALIRTKTRPEPPSGGVTSSASGGCPKLLITAARMALSIARGHHPVGVGRDLANQIVARAFEESALTLEVNQELSVSLVDLAVDDDRIDVRDVGEQNNGRDRIEDRGDVRALAVDDDDIGLLAGSKGAGSILEAADMRAVDGCRPQDVAGGEHGLGNIDIGFPALSVHRDALRSEYRPHLREHVSSHGGDDVDAQAGTEPEFASPEARGGPVSHLKLDLGCDRDLAAGVGDELPLLLAQIAGVDVGRVRPQQIHLVELAHHVEPACHTTHADVNRDWKVELASKVPIVFHDLWLAESGASCCERHRN